MSAARNLSPEAPQPCATLAPGRVKHALFAAIPVRAAYSPTKTTVLSEGVSVGIHASQVFRKTHDSVTAQKGLDSDTSFLNWLKPEMCIPQQKDDHALAKALAWFLDIVSMNS